MPIKAQQPIDARDYRDNPKYVKGDTTTPFNYLSSRAT